MLETEPLWSGWTLVCREHRDDNSFEINERYSEVCGALGPVLVIQPVQSTPSRALRDRLQSRVVVLEVTVACAEDVWSALDDMRAKHDAGEPLLPIKYVAAMYVLWKLSRERRWGGNSKAYMWATDLPKGRGMPEAVSHVVPEVANDLRLVGLLDYKRSQTGIKYCLSPSKQAQIYDIMDRPRYPDERLPASVRKSVEQVSARLLDDGAAKRQADKINNPSAMEREDLAKRADRTPSAEG